MCAGLPRLDPDEPGSTVSASVSKGEQTRQELAALQNYADTLEARLANVVDQMVRLCVSLRFCACVDQMYIM